MCQRAAIAPQIRSGDELRILVELRKLEAVVKQDEYDRIAAELQDLLLLSWDAASRAAIEDALRAIASGGSGDGAFSRSDLEAILGALEARLGVAFGNGVAPLVAEQITLAFERGVFDAGFSFSGSFHLADSRALQWLEEHHLYWVRGHFDLHTRERIQKLGSQVIEEGLSRTAAGEVFARELGEKLGQSQSYWTGLANHTVTRSREFGHTEAYEAAGVERYQIVTIEDERRSEVCELMDGKTFPVSAAVAIRDKLMAAENPEDVKRISPWLTADEIRGMTEEQLVAAGFIQPPFHFGCRSRTVIAS